MLMGSETLEILKRVSKHYDIPGEIVEFTQFTSGHINYTYNVRFANGDGTYHNYIFQKVNEYVFKDPVKIMRNVKQITLYLKSKKTEYDCDIIHFIDNKLGKNYTVCEEGFWRVSPYIKNSVAYDKADDPKVLFSAGYAFGRFLDMLSEFPMERLYETIPDFHNTKKRLDYLFEVAEEDPTGRAKEVKAEIKFFEDIYSTAIKLVYMQKRGELPLRVTHNDTKYNNILMDKDTCQPLCVIDLDTVMPGLAAYDFGDAVRFAASTAVEDETDLSKVGLDIEKYTEFTKGFINASKGFLTKKEVDTLALGAIIITVELASRFLADHINGDKYFRIHRPNHNLDRARCQIKLAQDMIAKYETMHEIVENSMKLYNRTGAFKDRHFTE